MFVQFNWDYNINTTDCSEIYFKSAIILVILATVLHI